MICPECGAHGYKRESKPGNRPLNKSNSGLDYIWCCEKCLFEWEESDPKVVYVCLIKDGMYYKDAYMQAYGKKAPGYLVTRTPDSEFIWPTKGWLTHSFGPLILRKHMAMITMYVGLAIMFLGIAGYAEWGFPHGPKFFTGEFEEVCQNDRRCSTVPVYEEDTRNLENPGWVDFVRVG